MLDNKLRKSEEDIQFLIDLRARQATLKAKKDVSSSSQSSFRTLTRALDSLLKDGACSIMSFLVLYIITNS